MLFTYLNQSECVKQGAWNVNDLRVDVFSCGNRFLIMGYVLTQFIISYHAALNHVHVTALLLPQMKQEQPRYWSAKNFHLPVTNLTIYQKGAYYTGTKIFNHLPTRVKNVANEIQVFKKTLKSFLLDNSFYSIDEYFNANKWYTFMIVMISCCNR